MLIASAFNFRHVDILQDTIGDPRKNLMLFEFSQSFHFQFRVSRYITGLHRTSVLKVIVIWIFYELLFSISSVLIYYGTQSDIRVKRYCRLNLLRDFIINYERLDILRDSFEHPSEKLLLFDFAQSFSSEFRASRYITGFIQTSEWKVIVVWFCSELLFWISSVSIYYGTQSDIRVKSYCRLIFLRASVFNCERLDILRDTIGHPS